LFFFCFLHKNKKDKTRQKVEEIKQKTKICVTTAQRQILH